MPLTNTINPQIARVDRALSPILACLKAGFPSRLLLPIAPIDALGIAAAGQGKIPAHVAKNLWKPLPGWRMGVLPETVRTAAHAGANSGLVLGQVAQGRQFLAVDFDNAVDNPEQIHIGKAFNAVALEVMRAAVGSPLWIRFTRPGRALILLAISTRQDPGLKRVYWMSHPEWGSLGKIEILSYGQQVVIAGRHPHTRCPMWWERSDRPGLRRAAPTATEIPELADRATVDRLLDVLKTHLAPFGIVFHASKIRQALATGASPEEQSPPDAEIISRLFERLPHDARVSRDDYVSTMLAAVGCLDALDALGRLEAGDEARIRNAATRWAARWTGPDGKTTTLDVEQSKWDHDWSQRAALGGWRTLLAEASRLGLEDPAIEDAAEDFAVLVDVA